MTIRVECHSGFKGYERLIGFQRGERWLAVEQTIDRWYDSDGSYFHGRG